jgi:hypothetical protein
VNEQVFVAPSWLAWQPSGLILATNERNGAVSERQSTWHSTKACHELAWWITVCGVATSEQRHASTAQTPTEAFCRSIVEGPDRLWVLLTRIDALDFALRCSYYTLDDNNTREQLRCTMERSRRTSPRHYMAIWIFSEHIAGMKY